jgi:hypothetical protein
MYSLVTTKQSIKASTIHIIALGTISGMLNKTALESTGKCQDSYQIKYSLARILLANDGVRASARRGAIAKF